MNESRPDTGRKPVSRLVWAGVGLGLAVLALAFSALTGWLDRRELMVAGPDAIPSNPGLVRIAERIAEPAYRDHCAACHGTAMTGDPVKGTPNLTDGVWLYDFGRVSDIERTVLYGIRSGHGKSHNVTDMPGVGVMGILSANEVRDVVAYTLSLSGRDGDRQAIARGETLFQGKGNCYDCHAPDAKGNSDYGAPSLSDDEWVWGGDDASVYRSTFDGRHGLCPAWMGRLDFPTIRALAVFIHARSKEAPDPFAQNPPSG